MTTFTPVSHTINRIYHFESGHFLPEVPDGHKCKRQHGHNYKMEVKVAGPTDKVGFLIDFWDLDRLVQPHIDVVDHRNLNDIEGLENPTAEHISEWFFRKIELGLAVSSADLLRLESVTIWETPECWACCSRSTPSEPEAEE